MKQKRITNKSKIKAALADKLGVDTVECTKLQIKTSRRSREAEGREIKLSEQIG